MPSLKHDSEIYPEAAENAREVARVLIIVGIIELVPLVVDKIQSAVKMPENLALWGVIGGVAILRGGIRSVRFMTSFASGIST